MRATPCACPVRVLIPELIGTECPMCGCRVPAFEHEDEMILRYVAQQKVRTDR